MNKKRERIHNKRRKRCLRGAATLGITTFSIKTLSIIGLVATLSINDSQHRHSAKQH
jgi:hypothetical protein